MSRSTKPRKAYRRVWNGDGVKIRAEPWRCAAVFGPLENILAGIEDDGCVTTALNGAPIFFDHSDGTWYEIAPAIEGLIDTYALHCQRQGRELPLQPLRIFATKLATAMPLQESDLTDVRAAVTALRAETMQMTTGYARDLTKTIQVRVAMDTNRIPAIPQEQA